jgi:hypothetical protein
MLRLLLLVFLLAPFASLADEFYTLVKYKCDSKTNKITVTHQGAYNEQGKKLVANLQENAWAPFQLRATPGNNKVFSEPKTVIRQCQLVDGVYITKIKPVPEDLRNINGRCGDWETASIDISKNGINLVHLQLDQSCYDDKAPVITEITITAKNNTPIIRQKSSDEFYR